MESKKFTERDFTAILNKPELKVGLQIIYMQQKGKIIKMSGTDATGMFCEKEEYVVIELENPDKNGNSILELRKSMFNYLTYPQ